RFAGLGRRRHCVPAQEPLRAAGLSRHRPAQPAGARLRGLERCPLKLVVQPQPRSAGARRRSDGHARRSVMIGRLMAFAAVGALVCAPAHAQEHKWEFGATAGWTFSDGVSTSGTILAGDGNLYNRIDPKDSFSWGLSLGYHFTENWSFEGVYNQQQSKLTI